MREKLGAAISKLHVSTKKNSNHQSESTFRKFNRSRATYGIEVNGLRERNAGTGEFRDPSIRRQSAPPKVSLDAGTTDAACDGRQLVRARNSD
jgi:hypothetical protein